MTDGSYIGSRIRNDKLVPCAGCRRWVYWLVMVISTDDFFQTQIASIRSTQIGDRRHILIFLPPSTQEMCQTNSLFIVVGRVTISPTHSHQVTFSTASAVYLINGVFQT